MEFRVLGWPPDGPTLRLDHRAFPYAGKFVMSGTGKAVAVADGWTQPPPAREADAPAEGVYAATSFSQDRTDAATLWLRYLTVRADRQGEAVGPRLAAFAAAAATQRGYARVRIAVNNPFSYEALYKAGFGFTGRETGLAELVMERPGPRDRPTYQAGLDLFRAREPDDPEASFLARKEGADPPAVVEEPAVAETG